MAQEMMKDAKNSVAKEVSSIKAKAALSPIRDDLETIREDMRVLSQDAKTLGRDLKDEGRKQMDYAGERAREAMDVARERGRNQWAETMKFVQGNPGQSIAIAFVGGMVASLLLGRRS